MTIETDFFRRAGVDTEKDDQARRAVKQFRALQPTLTAYARILTKRRDVRVEMAARDNGSTDGNRIYYRPPIGLGHPTSHERRLCDKRDDMKRPLCPACAIREEVLVTIYHEIAHICFDSFAETSDADRANLLKQALEQVDSKYADRVKARIDAAPSHVKRSYMGLANLINEFLPIIVNALEDARVNRELFKARKGVKVMFDADTWKVFTEGVEQKDAEGKIIVKMWNEYPLNMQVIVGLFCKASGYEYSNWFVPKVTEALGDEELTSLLRRLDTIRSAGGVYHLSFPVLTRLRELGFCQTETDPDPEPEPQPEEEQGDDGSGEEGADGGEEEGEGEGAGGPGSSSDEASGGGQDQEAEGSERSGDDRGSDDAGSRDPEEGDGAVDEDLVENRPQVDDDSDSGAGAGDSDAEPEQGDPGAGDDQSEAGGSGTDWNEGEGSGDPSDQGEDSESEDASEESSPEQGSLNAEPDESPSDGAPEESDSDQSDDSSGGVQANQSDSSEQSAGNDTNPPEQGDAEASSDEVQSGSNQSDAHADASGSERGDAEGSLKSGEADPDELGGESTSATPEEPEGGHLEESPESDERPDLDGESESDEPIDSGADDGQGGTQVIENEKYDDLPMGSPEEAKAGLLKWGDHEEKPKSVEESDDESAVDRAIVQGIYFETPSRNIYGVREHRFGQDIVIEGKNMSIAWDHSEYTKLGLTKAQLGIGGLDKTAESILGPALLRMRVAFSDNQRGGEIRHKKSGKVDGRVLGKRAFHQDERLFKKRTMPGKKSYFVLIGMDVSGSTIGTNIFLEKIAVHAQAELLSRMGIPFAIYAHSGNYHNPLIGRKEGLDLDIYLVKEPDEVWDTRTQERLASLGPDAANLDGHTIEYYRKVLDGVDATDKIILYYTDGKMPAENHNEELEILQREIRICKQKGYHLLGVGIRTDSPVRHGLDTVQVNDDADVIKVVKHLEKRLLAD